MTKLANDLINKFLYPGIAIITYVELAKAADFGVMNIENGKGSKVPLSNPDHLMFRWEMNKGAVWPDHKHDCKEIIKIESGLFRYRGVNYGPGRIIHIQKRVPHRLDTIKPGVLYVEFIKP